MSNDCFGNNTLLVRGNPAAEELAALVGVLSAATPARAGTQPARTPQRPSPWVRSGRPATAAALPSERGPDTWRGSALPGRW